jgi:ribosomal protein S18 acetylase RimI-like enzyme
MEDISRIDLKPISIDDEEFIYQIFISSRPDLEWIGGVDVNQKDKLIHQQFICEHEYLQKEYPNAKLYVVLLSDIPVGRVYINKGEKFFHIITMAMLPKYRSKGIGSKLFEIFMKEASDAGKQINFQVSWFNYSARVLYERLGFNVIRDTGVYCEMQWTPD